MSASSKPPKPDATKRPSQTPAEKQAEKRRRLKAALDAALAVPQNQRVLKSLAKR
jgi:hypothetical protein